MRSPDDVPIHHLVVDSGGFIRNAPLVDLGSKIYSIQSVVDELKDKATRQRVKAYLFDIIYREPSTESIKAVIEVSKKTGDYASLSVTDLKVIALAHDLHVEYCGREGIAYDVQPKPPMWQDSSKRRPHNAAGKPKSEVLEEEQIEGNDHEKDEQSEGHISEEEITNGIQRMGFGTWVDESNLLDVVSRMQATVDPAVKKMEVACLTTDFALQNVLLHMKLNIASIDGMRVTRLRTFILRCRICKKTTPVVTKQFCPNCGHDSLHKVGVSVDKDGNQTIHINWERERVTRGYRYSLPTPKGGKHASDIRVTEDHLMPQNRMAKVVQVSSFLFFLSTAHIKSPKDLHIAFWVSNMG
jgi:RNA-binding protein NOB1